jgi:stage III sporulation protein AD
MDIVKIAMIGISGVLLAMMLKQHKGEYALYLGLTTAILILIFSVDRLSLVMETIRQIQTYTGLNSQFIKIMIKMIGITYVAEFAAGICKDAGFSSVGNQIEMFGKFSIMAVSVPILLTLIETIEGLLGV